MNGLGFLSYALTTADNINSVMNKGREDWKARILEEYSKTYKMPRKMKKRKRKELNSEWSLANYDPFENLLGGF